MFNLNRTNRNLVDHLIQLSFKNNMYDLIMSNLNIQSINIKVPDLAQMMNSRVDIYYDEKHDTTKFLNGELIFDKLTDKVFRMGVLESCNLQYLYKNYLSKLFTLQNIYGIVGKDKETDEPINFSNPFRLLTLFRTPERIYKLDSLFLYKKNDVFEDKLTNKEKLTLEGYLSLYINLFRKGLESKIDDDIETNRYISLNKVKEEEGYKTIYTLLDSSKNENKVSKYSFMYFSDILLYNSFCPYYALFNIKINKGSLYGSYFKHVPMYSPNISRNHKVCTGNLRQLSTEGIECLKISNLGSPFFKDIFEKKECSYYVDLNIKFAKSLLEQEFKKEEE